MNDIQRGGSRLKDECCPNGSSEVVVEDRLLSTQPHSGATATVCVAKNDWRVIDDGIQWIVQRHTGGRWRDVSYYRSRRVLIERLGASTIELETLPEFHSEPNTPECQRCNLCGRWKCLPRGGVSRHLFCAAARRNAG
jgi:hypothetical protein